MDIKAVQATYCKPKPEQCRCTSLLESLLALEDTINKITGSFTADPFIKICKCYLGAAARQGFKFLRVDANSGGTSFCIGSKPLTVDNYAEMCENLEINKCYVGAEITRTDPDDIFYPDN